MTYQLNITRDGGPLVTVRADIDFDFSSDRPIPDPLAGNLLDLTFDQILTLKFAQDVTVGLAGQRYRFHSLNKDGTCELTKG
jgi:hypothetical protein